MNIWRIICDWQRGLWTAWLRNEGFVCFCVSRYIFNSFKADRCLVHHKIYIFNFFFRQFKSILGYHEGWSADILKSIQVTENSPYHKNLIFSLLQPSHNLTCLYHYNDRVFTVRSRVRLINLERQNSGLKGKSCFKSYFFVSNGYLQGNILS